ncbi:MAG: META domain-containing protein [Pseudomonadota bacterium]
MTGRQSLLAGVAVMACLSGCGDDTSGGAASGGASAPAMTRVLEGEVFYRERILLPPGGELEVQLQDISRPDALAAVVASVVISLDGPPPYPFAIEYSDAQVDSRMRYGIGARIEVDGELRFINTDYIDPFADGPLSVLVRAAPGATPAVAATPDTPELAASAWALDTLGGEEAPTGAGAKPLTLEFDENGRAGGFAGCNRFTGTYSLEGAAEQDRPLSFGPMAATMMACPSGMDVEREYLQALESVDAFDLDAGRLVLLAGGEAVATYRSQ